MNGIRLFAFIALCMISLISSAAPDKKEEIKLRLFRGEHYTYDITQENTIKQDPGDEVMLSQKIGLKIRQDVIERLGNGNFVMEASFLSFNLFMDHKGIKQRYTSDTVNVQNKLYKSLNFLTTIKLNYEVSPEGVVSKLTGFETITEYIQFDPELSRLLRCFGSEEFMTEFYNYIPAQNVAVGDHWSAGGILPDMMKLKYDILYTLKEASVQNLTLNRGASFNYSTEVPLAGDKTGQLNETGSQKGILILDPKTHMCISSDLDQQIEINLPSENKPDEEKITPLKVNTRTKILLVKK
ncbi:MAG TPA: DUF6263 family protein [Prolixibacteraceae bacterium]|jgi:hypothetical protein